MKCRWRLSTVAQMASIGLAWACWATAYWLGNWWLVVASLVPYLLSNRFGHLLDHRRTDLDAG